MTIELKVPEVGESVTEVQVGMWNKAEGDAVEADEPLVEIETDKATVEVPAPCAGAMGKILKKTGEAVSVGDVIGYMEEGQPGTVKAPSPSAKAPAEEPRVMPAAKRELAQHDLKPEDVAATGPGGRLLKEDVARHVEEPAPVPQPWTPEALAQREEEVVPMTPMRLRIAKRLVEAQQNAALLTTFNEIDMSEVKALRATHGEGFNEKHGVKLGFMSFFVKATINALKLIPRLNAEIRGRDIVYHNYFDIGVALSTKKGLVVPILRNAEAMSFAEIEEAIVLFATQADKNDLKLADLEGGTFTISNGGVYGSLLSTPIVNPPQSGVLGMHAIQDRPMAINGEVVIRPMMYVAVTYDHRIVDGRDGVLFLRRIKDCIEKPSRLLLEI